MASTSGEPRAPRDTAAPSSPFRTGWTAFAAILMIFGGAMAVFQGIAAIAKDDVFVTTRDYVFQFNLTGWGWIHLVLGIVIVLAGCALFTGAAWARAVGIVLAGLGALANFLWLPHYPLWSIVLIALDVFIIWALCAAPEQRERV
ncbi:MULTISPECIES: hypothetical protein [unclassified Streptomyces]|uniref:DUF7144 family membrane protein n=1 Tax=unclassified Streptomyces TaxID=2593676 RepID=UPI00224EB326|nr:MULTISPECIES: hypothetical protein [unclassified Streptomyces]MCX5138662.1 hypothetical protein [Streptomyces sp. NBC_00338]WRZ63343.1 hypothetical protein OG408_05385 [Streptomyces sp. NBC_01257]WSU57306.1 hypothetical protein OG450_05330 [Streptomyces sp. NBC_01104]